MSHPVWVRGLKLDEGTVCGPREAVAPRVGAWIETSSAMRTRPPDGSHPVWVRGLKRRSSS